MMKLLILFVLVYGVLGFEGFEEGDDVEKIVAEINSQKVSWTASLDYAREVPLSVFAERAKNIRPTPMERREAFRKQDHPIMANLIIPDSYDLRQHHTSCQSIGTVLNQGNCGSCWAFGANEVAADRLCIKRGITVSPAPQYSVNCDKTCYAQSTICQKGCSGGFADMAFEFMQSTATHSGFTDAACVPYRDGEFSCSTQCSDGSAMTRHHSVGRAWLPTEKAIQQDIMLHGPVTAFYTLYEDFRTYTTGVYHHRTGKSVGGHIVKVIGWGTENSEKYWLGVNSWGTTFGQSGLFKFRRGQNDCLFEEDMWTTYFDAGDMPTLPHCTHTDPVGGKSYNGHCYPIPRGTLQYCTHINETSCVFWNARVADRICAANHDNFKLRDDACGNAYKAFCCGMFIPRCQPDKNTTLPICRKTCEAINTQCSPSVLQASNCNLYPTSACFAPVAAAPHRTPRCWLVALLGLFAAGVFA
eukprot:gnl/Trimastix_PCT/1131.p1 GENE.gnl/Trimastix_PCT/1131~~gnl/Trimastix_PCT/1131.p1  ORF type:complete len:471 (+),score=95.03 gnl/Trimastix_PCT/1131:75-1487(+)